MSYETRSAPRRIAVGLFAALLAVTVFALVVPAGATSGVTATRLGGIDRIATAIEVSKATFTSATEAVVATGMDFPDALAAGVLAGKINGPVLLTWKDSVGPGLDAELSRLGVTKVYLLGGTDAISASVKTSLTTATRSVERIAGATRVETAIAIAEKVGAANVGLWGGKKTAILSRNNDFADAMSASAPAFSGLYPILLTETAALNAATSSELTALGIQQVIIAGGTAAISDAVKTAVEAKGMTAVRVAGLTRYGTAVAMAEKAITDLGYVTTKFVLATGLKFPDGLAAGPLAGKAKAAILFMSSLPDETKAELEKYASTITNLTVIGGTAAISDADVEAALVAAGKGATNQTYSVTPSGAASLTRVAPNLDTDATDDRQYAVNGLDSTKSYVVALFSGADLQTDSTGVVTFDDATGDNIADRTVPTADITVANGAAQLVGTSLVTVVPVNGTITFTIDGDGANEIVVPVIWLDSVVGGTSVLNLTVPATANLLPKTPAEAFGIGGATTYAPPAATSGLLAADVAITGVDKTANTITTAGALYSYDDNDTFYLYTAENALAVTEANRVTFAVFEAAVSAGDDLDSADVGFTDSGTFYQASASLPSKFVLENLAPLGPTTLAAVAGTNTATQIDLTWVASTTASVVSYNVYSNDETALATDVTELGLIGSTDADTTEFTASSLTASTTYTFVVTAVDESGEESPLAVGTAGAGDDNTVEFATTAVVETVAPTITDAWVSTDGAVVGILIEAAGTSNDVIDFAFSERMIGTLGGTDATFLRLSDGTNVFQVDCGVALSCTLDNNETKLGANVNLVTDDHLQIDLALATITRISGTGALDLASGTITVTLVSNAWDDLAGNQLDLAGSADKVIDNE